MDHKEEHGDRLNIPADPPCAVVMLGAAAVLTAGADRAGCARAAEPDEAAGVKASEGMGAKPSCVAAATRAAAAFPLRDASDLNCWRTSGALLYRSATRCCWNSTSLSSCSATSALKPQQNHIYNITCACSCLYAIQPGSHAFCAKHFSVRACILAFFGAHSLADCWCAALTQIKAFSALEERKHT